MHKIIQLLSDEFRNNAKLSLSALASPLALGTKNAHNRIVYQPMEGCDSDDFGRPSELTERRYSRFAEGGPGIIWFEAVSLSINGRSSPHQLILTRDTLDSFKRLTAQIKKTCFDKNGYEPLLAIQLTHSGRYSRPFGDLAPVIARNNPYLEKNDPLDNSCIISDDELDRISETFGSGAALASEAGFDIVDTKCCHGYLSNELLSAIDRPGKYGGCFENRIRFLLNCIVAARASVASNTIVTTRLNIYDGFPWPYGFGVSKAGGTDPDFTEPLLLIEKLKSAVGIPLLNISMGNPYVNPHVNRPFKHGTYSPPESPNVGISRIMAGTEIVQKSFPGIAVVAFGLSYLGKAAPTAASWMIENSNASLAGFGRMIFADPMLARNILSGYNQNKSRACIACGKCAELLRTGCPTGCVVYDRDIYLKKYLTLSKSRVVKKE